MPVLDKKMKITITLFLLLLTVNIQSVFASPIDDLASPLQNIRNNAAEKLRKSYVGTPMSQWTPTIKKIKKGQTKKEILELLRPFKIAQEGGDGTGQSHSESYRLDNEWILICWFQNQGDKLIDSKLTLSLKYIWTNPPEGFTGKWITYFVNGQKSHEIKYKNGKYSGEFISYYSNGSKSVVQHYSDGKADGKDTGYYPSGRIAYQGQYKNGTQIGIWTWYKEDGRVISTEKYERQ